MVLHIACICGALLSEIYETNKHINLIDSPHQPKTGDFRKPTW